MVHFSVCSFFIDATDTIRQEAMFHFKLCQKFDEKIRQNLYKDFSKLIENLTASTKKKEESS